MLERTGKQLASDRFKEMAKQLLSGSKYLNTMSNYRQTVVKQSSNYC